MDVNVRSWPNEYKSVVHAIKAAGGMYWSADSWDLDAAQVKAAHELGIRVTVWTVNEPEEMAKFIDMGVDGIITDYPDRLRKVLLGKGITVPKGKQKRQREGLTVRRKNWRLRQCGQLAPGNVRQGAITCVEGAAASHEVTTIATA